MKLSIIAALAVALINPTFAQQASKPTTTHLKRAAQKSEHCRKLEREVYLLKHRRYACMNAQSACVAYWVK
jgi:hypothetical protein